MLKFITMPKNETGGNVEQKEIGVDGQQEVQVESEKVSADDLVRKYYQLEQQMIDLGKEEDYLRNYDGLGNYSPEYQGLNGNKNKELIEKLASEKFQLADIQNQVAEQLEKMGVGDIHKKGDELGLSIDYDKVDERIKK